MPKWRPSYSWSFSKSMVQPSSGLHLVRASSRKAFQLSSALIVGAGDAGGGVGRGAGLGVGLHPERMTSASRQMIAQSYGR